jgi:hypothetical protein
MILRKLELGCSFFWIKEYLRLVIESKVVSMIFETKFVKKVIFRVKYFFRRF